jgi:adenylyltransferase/sulfurtransferase
VQDNLSSENISILDGCDLVMDGTDNLKTRFLISEYCSREDTPWIYTAAIGEKGYSMFFDEKCFSCVFEDIQAGSLKTCETAGILREISSMAAASSARKAVNYLTGKEVEEKLDMIPSGRTLNVSSDGCKVCEKQSFQYLDDSSSTSSVCGKDKYHVDLNSDDLDLEAIKDKLDAELRNQYLVRAVFDGRKMTVFKDGRAIVEAEDEGHAEQLVSEKLGI